MKIGYISLQVRFNYYELKIHNKCFDKVNVIKRSKCLNISNCRYKHKRQPVEVAFKCF